ncbi:hypothetical protein ECEC1846_1679, partial [Escherichia coli EC1846]
IWKFAWLLCLSDEKITSM